MFALKLKLVSIDFSSMVRGMGAGILFGAYMAQKEVNWVISLGLGFVVIVVGHCIRYRKDKQDKTGNEDGCLSRKSNPRI